MSNLRRNFISLLERKVLSGEYTEEDRKYIQNLVQKSPNPKSLTVEKILNIVDIYDDFLNQEKTSEGIIDLKAKNRKILEEYVSKDDIFANPFLDYVHEENEREIKLMKGTGVGTKGIVNCRRCHLDNITFYSKQKSRGDEGETLFMTCLDCGHNWHE